MRNTRRDTATAITRCDELKQIIQNRRRWINISAASCIVPAAKRTGTGGKFSAQARSETKEIDDEALLAPTEKSKAKASEITPSAMNVNSPAISLTDIANAISHWLVATIPMATSVTKATYRYERKFIRNEPAPAWQLASDRNPTGRNLAHQLTDEIEQRRHYLRHLLSEWSRPE